MESYFRLSSNMSAEILLVELPLAALDSGIVCWIFAALTQTTRALRLRRLKTFNILRLNIIFVCTYKFNIFMYNILFLEMR